MGVERNCPIDIWDVIYLPNGTEVIKRCDMEKLLKALTNECKQWQNSDGKIWFDSPESYLREQLGMKDTLEETEDKG